MEKKILFWIILLLLVLEVAINSYLVYQDMTKSNSGVCVIGNACESVQDSSYGKILGIKLAYYGLVGFVLLLALFFINKKLFLAGAIFGTLASLYFISLQLFVLHQLCSVCMVIDISMLIILICSVYWVMK